MTSEGPEDNELENKNPICLLSRPSLIAIVPSSEFSEMGPEWAALKSSLIPEANLSLSDASHYHFSFIFQSLERLTRVMLGLPVNCPLPLKSLKFSESL